MNVEGVTMHEPVSILMPVCNEADVLRDVVAEWARDVVRYLPSGSEMVFDEAGSTDGTKEILADLTRQYAFIRVMYHEKKDGFAAAARRLYAAARCPWVFFTDSDGQYVASDFWKVAKYADRYAFIHGAKLGRKDPLFRRMTSIAFNKFAGFLFEVHYLDLNSAFRLMRTDLVKEMLPKLNVMPALINAELLLRCELENVEIKQVYIRHRNREHGTSRGLPSRRYCFEGLRACWGLMRIKESYRLPPQADVPQNASQTGTGSDSGASR